jgi:hypothetical protein
VGGGMIGRMNSAESIGGSDVGMSQSDSKGQLKGNTFTDFKQMKLNLSKLSAYQRIRKADVRDKKIKGFMKESQSKSYLKIAVDSDSDYSEDEKNMSKRPSFA